MNLDEIKLVAQAYEHMRELMDERQHAHDQHHANEQKALDLQAKEYERRLDALNHAHQQEVVRNAQYVPREAFEAYKASVEARSEERMNIVVGRLTDLEARDNRQVGGVGAVVTVVAVAAGVAGVVALVVR